MDIALTTRWNASRHDSGEAMIDEILDLGFTTVELGYDLRTDLVPGVLKRVGEGAVRVGTVHNFCPVPIGAQRGHPELFTFADKDSRIRDLAVRHTARTLEFAAEVGADTVVTHSGNVDMKRFSYDLLGLLEAGQQYSPRYEKRKLKLEIKREKKAPKQMGFLRQSLDLLMPIAQEHGVCLALENLPTWEAFPTEQEFVELYETYGPVGLRYWHDIGHGQIRQNMGMILLSPWLERLAPCTAGLHVHDVAPAARDHVMPPLGGMVDFQMYKPIAERVQHRVIEPPPHAPAEEIRDALDYLQSAWGESQSADSNSVRQEKDSE